MAKAEEITASTPDAFMLQQFQNPNNPKVRYGAKGGLGLGVRTGSAAVSKQQTGQANCTLLRYRAVPCCHEGRARGRGLASFRCGILEGWWWWSGPGPCAVVCSLTPCM